MYDTPPHLICLINPFGTIYDTSSRKVRARNNLQQTFDGNIGIVDERFDPLNDFKKIVRGMFVAIPTAMPAEPFTKREGTAAGRTEGSDRDSS